MKTMILVSLSLLVATSSFAKNASVEKRIEAAVELLEQTAEGKGTVISFIPGTDVKAIMKEIATGGGHLDEEESFDSYWAGTNGSAWEADGMMWGEEDRAGAYAYVRNAIEAAFDESEQLPEDKVRFADGYTKIKRAFEILSYIKSVKFGVGPIGAVQCGVILPALLILDTENGKAYSIEMEGSGC